MQANLQLTPMQALPKLMQYCAYQERCHSEVQHKLYSYGITGADADSIISTLIQNNYLNEERYAIAYAGGKHRTKLWGKVKIKYALKAKQVSDYSIRKALASLPYDDYEASFMHVYTERVHTVRSEKNIYTKKRKILTYLQQRGYEVTRIQEQLKTL